MKLQVKSLREGGFCRLGVKWPTEGKVVDASEYTDEQWERLMKEPNLKVSPHQTDGDEEAAAGSAEEDSTTTDTSEATKTAEQAEPTKEAQGSRKTSGKGA